jgi:hypothetical protein
VPKRMWRLGRSTGFLRMDNVDRPYMGSAVSEAVVSGLIPDDPTEVGRIHPARKERQIDRLRRAADALSIEWNFSH